MRQTAAELGDQGNIDDTDMMRLTTPCRAGLEVVCASHCSSRIYHRTLVPYRLAACLGVEVDLIEPCGFVLDDRRLKRAALDYLTNLSLQRHSSWKGFLADRNPRSRLVLMTTAGSVALHRFVFAADDTIVLGRETAGVPEAVHRAAAARLVIPLRRAARSLNVALAGAIALAEALRQTALFPGQ